MKSKLLNAILRKMGYTRKELVIKKKKEQKYELIALEEKMFELKAENQNLLMEVEFRRIENKELAAEVEDERTARLASEKSLKMAKEIMKKDKAIKKVFGGDK